MLISERFDSFFVAASEAAGALIGLLFIVIALKPRRILGDSAEPELKRLAISSFTGLVNAFFVSTLALIPDNSDLGIGAGIVAIISLYHTLRLHFKQEGMQDIAVFVLSVAAYASQLGIAIAILVRPRSTNLVTYLCFVLIGCFAVALSRAWQLMEGITASREERAADDG